MATKSSALGLIALICLPLAGLARRCGDDVVHHAGTLTHAAQQVDTAAPLLDDAAHALTAVARTTGPEVEAAALRWRATGLSRVEQAKETLGEPYAGLVLDVACLHIQSLARTGARPSQREYADFLLEKAGSSRHRVQNALRDLTEFLETLQQREDGQSISAALAGDIGCEARSLYELSK